MWTTLGVWDCCGSVSLSGSHFELGWWDDGAVSWDQYEFPQRPAYLQLSMIAYKDNAEERFFRSSWQSKRRCKKHHLIRYGSKNKQAWVKSGGKNRIWDYHQLASNTVSYPSCEQAERLNMTVARGVHARVPGWWFSLMTCEQNRSSRMVKILITPRVRRLLENGAHAIDSRAVSRLCRMPKSCYKLCRGGKAYHRNWFLP